MYSQDSGKVDFVLARALRRGKTLAPEKTKKKEKPHSQQKYRWGLGSGGKINDSIGALRLDFARKISGQTERKIRKTRDADIEVLAGSDRCYSKEENSVKEIVSVAVTVAREEYEAMVKV